MATYYWVGGSGTWDNSSTANWSATSGGAAGAGPPLAADNVNFDANSGTAATVAVAATAVANNVTINKSDISLSLSGAPTFGGQFTLTSGGVVLNNNILTTRLFASTGTGTRSLAFGTSGAVNVTGNNSINVWYCATITNFTITGTPTVNLTYSGSVGTRQVYHGSGTGPANGINLNVTAGTDTVAITPATTASGMALLNLNFTGFSGTWSNLGGNSIVTIYGDLILSPTMASVYSGTTPLRFIGASGTNSVTSNGTAIAAPVYFQGSTGSTKVWTLVDDFASTSTLSLGAGTLNASNKNVSIGGFALLSGTKTLTLGSGTWTVAGNWDANTNVANLTVSASTGTINMTSASAKSFAGGGKAWPTLNQGGTGALTIQQSNTFANITNTVQPATITFTAGTTQTVSAFGVSGTSGNLITLDSSVAGSRATLLDNSETVSVSFVSVKDLAATGSAEWQAYTTNGNVDAGNNIGWEFIAPAPIISAEYPTSLRSFTERRSF